MNKRVLFFISLLIVALGQPSFVPWLGALAAGFGYALFWRSVAIYPLARQRFGRAVLWYSLVSLIQLSWMTSIEYQGLYILLVLTLLVLWLGLQFGLLTLLIPYNRFLSLSRLLAIAALWTLMEWSRFHVLCGYSWNLVGMALSHSYSLQMATLFGVLGLSFWVILVNLFALRALVKKTLKNVTTWGVLAAFPYFFGMGYCLYYNLQKPEAKDIHCALVQTGLLPTEKNILKGKMQAFISPYEQWRQILLLLKQSLNQPLDLLVLPESVVPFTSHQNIYSQEKVREIFNQVFGAEIAPFFPVFSSEEQVSNAFWAQSLANYFKVEVIIGLDHLEEDGTTHNSAFYFRPNDELSSRYDKQVLMPLAEYLPFEWLRPLVKTYGVTHFFTPGQDVKIFEGKLPYSVSICYEETFPEIARAGRKQGAKLLVNVSNDAWYPFSRLPSQHYEHARLRAVENGIPLIRSCNMGITAAIDSFGREIAKLQEYKTDGTPYAGILYTTIKAEEHPTPYLFWGNQAILAISFFFLSIFLLSKLFLLAVKVYYGK